MTHEEKVMVCKGLMTIRLTMDNIYAALNEFADSINSMSSKDDKYKCEDKKDTHRTCVDCFKKWSIDDMWCQDCIKRNKVIDGKCYRTIIVQDGMFGPILMDSICYREDLDPLVDCMISIRLCPKLMQEVLDFYNDLPREDIEKLSVFWRMK